MNSNPHIAARLKAKADAVKASHSSYWMGKSGTGLQSKVSEGSIEYLEHLRSIQRSVAGFVKIATGQEYPVVFSGGQQSYTDGKTIVISADTDPTSMDSLVGTALHEAAHCLLSNYVFKFLPEMSALFEAFVRELKTSIESDANRLGIPMRPAAAPVAASALGANEKGSVYELVQMAMNVLEDRRIDYWMYQSAPGYQPYYDSMYDKYWHSADIDKAMQDPRFHTLCVENYMLFVINMTNKHYNPAVMPGLAEIRKIANLTPKGLEGRGDADPKWKMFPFRNPSAATADQLPSLFVDAVKIVEIMLKHSLTYENQNRPTKGKGEGKDGNQIGDLPNMDFGRVGRAIDRQRKFLNHDTDKKKASAEVQAQLDQLSDTKADIKEVDGDFIAKDVKAKVIIYRDVSAKTAQSKVFPFSYTRNYRGGNKNPDSVKALSQGMRMGQILAARIAVTQDESPLTFTRQQSGRLDKRLIAGLGYGQSSVFSHTFVERKEPCTVWIDVDLSGSMDGDKYINAMAVAVAIAYAAEKTRTLNCVVAVRDADHEAANLAILYDSRRHTFNQLRSVVPYISVAGGTPEGLCFEAVKDELLAMGKAAGTKYFINLSDGEPMFQFIHKSRSYSYSGQPAWDHTRRLMNQFRLADINVLSYFISDHETTHAGFRQMYGKSAAFVKADQVNGIVRTLNRLLTGE
jgi:hypothetical protein